jgi:hypothetical protein
MVVGVLAAGLGEMPNTAGPVPPARPFDGLRTTLYETSLGLRVGICTQRFATTAQGTAKPGDHELLGRVHCSPP